VSGQRLLSNSRRPVDPNGSRFGMKDGAGLLVLQLQGARLTLDPGRGGVIRELNWHGQDVLRPTPAQAGDDPFDSACFPMVPYVNRVAHGRFGFAGRTVQLARNWSEDPHPLHGQGWRKAWSVLSHSATQARLRFEGGGDEWPWRYRSEQQFDLEPNGLSVELSMENLSETAMPAMLGLHPYFPDAAHARLEARLPRVWRADSGALPVEEIPTPVEWSFDSPRVVREVPLDHGFVGWNGKAVLRWPDRTVTLSAPACAFLHVFTPRTRDFFCIEPQNAAPGALSRGAALAVAPGQRASIRAHFAVGAS
jgi:aldose 1-epimerase